SQHPRRLPAPPPFPTRRSSDLFRDAETLARTLYRAGAVRGGRVDLRELTHEIERKMLQYHGASLDEMVNPATLMDLVQLCTRFRSEEHTSELQSRENLVCRLLL